MITASQQPGGAASQQERGLRAYLAVVAVFTLGNASDAFLIVRAADAGIPGAQVLLVWTLHNAVKALLSRPLGALSDRLGRKRLIVGGWALYAAVYLGFGCVRHAWQVWALFAIYGLHYALVEGAERALVADLAAPARRGRAFGWFYATTGLCVLPASAMFGLLYRRYGAFVPFATAAGLALAAAVLLAAVVPASRREAMEASRDAQVPGKI